MQDNPGGELDPAVDDQRHYKKNLLPVNPAYIRGQKKAVIVAAKSEQFTEGEAEHGQFLQNRKNLTRIVRFNLQVA